MKHHRKNLILIIFIIIYIFSYNYVFPQTKPEFNYGVQVDITSAVFVTTISGSADLDILKIDKGYLGTRVSLEHYGYYGPDGANGSPFTDIDFSARLTVPSKIVEVNLCPGVTYHSTTGRRNENGLYLKAAGDIKLKIYKNYIGFLIKFGISEFGYGGIGIFLGFNSKDTK